MTLKMKFSLSKMASWLYGSVMNLMTPLIIHEPTVSPGCTLDDIITHYLSFLSLEVMVR